MNSGHFKFDQQGRIVGVIGIDGKKEEVVGVTKFDTDRDFLILTTDSGVHRFRNEWDSPAMDRLMCSFMDMKERQARIYTQMAAT